MNTVGTEAGRDELIDNVTALLQVGIISLPEARRMLDLPNPRIQRRTFANLGRGGVVVLVVLFVGYMLAAGMGAVVRGDPAAYLPSWLPGSPFLQGIYSHLVPPRVATRPPPKAVPTPVVINPNPLPDPSAAQLSAWTGRLRELERGFFTRHQATAFYVNEGRLLTALHVIAAAPDDTWTVVGHGYHVRRVAGDAGLDLALLTPTDLTTGTSPVIALGAHRPLKGQRLWGLCAAGAAPTWVLFTVLSPDQTATGQTLDGSSVSYTRAGAIVLNRQAPDGCGGGPLVDAAGTALGIIEATGSGHTIALSAVDISGWLRAG